MTSPRSKRIEDEVLIAQYCAGNIEAVGELYRRHYKKAVSLALKYVKKPHIAEELAQEAFLLVFKKGHQFKGDSKFTTWLHTIVTRLCGVYLRTASHNHNWHIPISSFKEGDLHEAFFDWSVKMSKPEGDVLLRRRMQKAFSKVRADHRTAVFMFTVEGHEEQSVARILNKTVPVVKTWSTRGKWAFRRAIIAVARELDIAA
jgi:RNA polymerase sigma factor (sigma-70 family)